MLPPFESILFSLMHRSQPNHTVHPALFSCFYLDQQIFGFAHILVLLLHAHGCGVLRVNIGRFNVEMAHVVCWLDVVGVVFILSALCTTFTRRVSLAVFWPRLPRRRRSDTISCWFSTCFSSPAISPENQKSFLPLWPRKWPTECNQHRTYVHSLNFCSLHLWGWSLDLAGPNWSVHFSGQVSVVGWWSIWPVPSSSTMKVVRPSTISCSPLQHSSSYRSRTSTGQGKRKVNILLVE